MSRAKRYEERRRHALLRQLQKARAVAKCIGIAVDYAEDDPPDLAEAIAGLLLLVEGAIVTLDQLGSAP